MKTFVCFLLVLGMASEGYAKTSLGRVVNSSILDKITKNLSAGLPSVKKNVADAVMHDLVQGLIAPIELIRPHVFDAAMNDIFSVHKKVMGEAGEGLSMDTVIKELRNNHPNILTFYEFAYKDTDLGVEHALLESILARFDTRIEVDHTEQIFWRSQ